MSFCPNYSHPKFKEIIAALDNDPVKATQYYINYNGDLDTLYEDVVMKQDIPELDAVKSGVQELFDSNPELANIGTAEQYSQYLDTIFPDSKLKKILYHGTVLSFDKFKIGNYGAIFFSNNSDATLNWAKQLVEPALDAGYTDVEAKNVPVIINAKNIVQLEGRAALNPKELNDGDIAYYEDNEYAVVSPEQIHILGTKDDIEGFKAFVKAPFEASVDMTAIGMTVPLETREIFNTNDLMQEFLNRYIIDDKLDLKKFVESLKDTTQFPNAKLSQMLNNMVNVLWNPFMTSYNMRMIVVPDLPGNTLGQYYYDYNMIQLSFVKIVRRLNEITKAANSKTQAMYSMHVYMASLVNHEILHAFHPRYLSEIPLDRWREYLENEEGVVAKYGDREKQFALKIGELYDLASKAGLKAGTEAGEYYGMTNFAEFFTEAMTNRNFQLALAKIKYKTTGKSIWQRFIGLLKDFFKKNYKIDIKDTVLEEAVTNIAEFINADPRLGRMRGVYSPGDNTFLTYHEPSFSVQKDDVVKPEPNLQKEFVKMVKLYKKEISSLQRMKVINRVKTANMKLNTKFKVVFRQVGQADIWRWEVVDMSAPKPIEKPAQPNVQKAVQMNIEFYQDRYTNDPSINDPDSITGASVMLSNGVFNEINDLADANTVQLGALDQIAKTLSSQLGDTPYSFITVEQAQSILGNRYRNQPAFFYNGRAYYIINRINGGIVFHEMAHPFVMAIAYYNQDLFNKLYNDLMSSPEGMQIYKDILDAEYDDLEAGSERFKMEMLVRALQAKFKMEKFMQKPSSGFAKVMKDILYAIKRMLREIFGKKIDISKLDASTTLDDLMTMLEKGGQFNIDRNVVTKQDVENYYESNKQFIEELSLLDSNTQQALLKEAYDNVVQHITLLQKNKNYEKLYEVLKDEFSQTELDAIKTNLSKHVDIINKRAQSFIDDAEIVSRRAQALVNTIHRLNKTMEKFDDHMNDLVNNIDDQDNGLRAYYYRSIAKHYRQFVDSLMNDMRDIVPVEASVRSLVNQLSTRIDNVLNKTQKFDMQVSKSALYAELKYIGEAIDRKYQDIITALEEKGKARGEDPKKYIDAWYKEWKGMTKEEYEEYQALKNKKSRSIKDLERLSFLQRELFNGAEITEEKIELALKGLSPDANPWSSFLEGYLYNPDIVVGGFGLYMKNATTDYLVKSQARMNDFFKDVYPLMEAAGFDPNKTDEFFEKITSLQDFGTIENDEMVKTTVHSFLAIHGGNYRWERDSRRSAIKVAEAEYSFERTDEDKRNAFVKAVKALREWEMKYMHLPYHPYFYERYSLFTDDEIGIEASARYEEAIQELGAYEYSIFAEDQYIDTTVQREEVRLKYKQLFSRYTNGVRKTGFELDVTERLIAFKEKTKMFYEWEEKPGAFIKALHKYQQELIDNGITRDNPLFREKTNIWIETNSVVKNKPSYWERRKVLIARYKEIMAMLNPQTQQSLDISKIYEELIDLAKPYRNADSEIEANEMSEAERKRVKEYEEKIEQLKTNLKKMNGLTDVEQQRLNELIQKAASLKGTGRRLEPWESDEMNELFQATKISGIVSPELKEELQTIFILLGEMTVYEPTVAYTDELNEILLTKEAEDFLRSIGRVDQNNQIIEYTPQNITALFSYAMSDQVIAGLKRVSPRFKAWFDQNHIVRKRFDPLTKAKVEVYERLYIWNVSRPNSEEDLESTMITEEDGYQYAVKRVPSIRFSKRRVKDSIKVIDNNGIERTITLKTPEIVGVTKDNRNEWLPRTDVENSPYIDQNFVNLRDSSNPQDKATYAALEAMKAWHLATQEGLSYYSKLYLDVPRYQKENLDLLRTRKKRQKAVKDGTNAPPEDEKVKSFLQIMVDRFKQFYYGSKDAAELDGTGAQYNYKKDTMILVRADALDNDITDIPISGLYKIDYNDVSTDVGKSMLRYMLGAERHKKLLEISPVAQAIQNTVSENRPNPKNMIDKKNFLNRAILSVIRPKDKSVREKAINNLIDREFKGEVNTGFGQDSPFAQNVADFMFKTASFGFFAVNIPSALKNMITPKYQALIMSAGREYMDYKSYRKGEVWAFKTMGQLSFEIYKPQAHNLDLQLVEIMDIVPNRFVEKMGERVSRTMLRDTVGTRGFNFGWLYNFRKWTETQSTLALAGSMMIKQMITDKDGNEVKFIDAWELNDQKKIQLKKNIDPEWGITYDENGNMIVGREFKRFKNLVQQAGNLMQGAYAQFEQPELQRHLLGRMVSFLKRYLTPMLVSRWGFAGDFGNVRPRFNAGLGNTHMGYYTSTLRALLRIVKSRGGWMHYLTNDEKADILKTIAEVLIVTIPIALLGAIFGWDPEDEDKYEKLRKKSGPLPLPGVVEDPAYPFRIGGYLENHTLLLLMQLRSENEAFIPWPNYGLDDYVGILNLKSVAVDPVFKRIEDILTMLIAQVTGDDKAYYKRSIGPYAWQQEGGAKISNYLFKTVGITGSAADPVKGIKDLQGVISRK